MSKRVSESGQMRREDYEHQMDREDGDDNDTQEFRKAGAEVIQKRRIISVSRRFGKKKQDSDGQVAPAPVAAPVPAAGSNPFSGFTGLTGDPASTSADAAKSKNPFAGFTGLTGAPPAPTPAPALADASKPKNPFAGFTGLTGAVPAPAPAGTFAGFTVPLSKAQPIIPPPANGTQSKPVALPFSFPGGGPDAPKDGFGRDMAKLNASFSGFVSKQAVNRPHSVWVEAAKGYLAYVQKLEARHGLQPPPPRAAITEDPDLLAPSPVAAPSTSAPAPAPAPAAAPSKFSFGAANPLAAAATPAPAPAAGPFSFGNSAATTAPTPAPGGFGGFSFAAAPAPAAAATVVAVEEDSDAMPPEEATVVERNADEDANDITEHEVRAKLHRFSKPLSEWKDMGVGVLRLMKHNETKKSRILMRNSAGKINLNTFIFPTMKFDANAEKGCVGFVTAVKNDDGKQELVKFLIKVKKENFGKMFEVLERLHKESL